jgi:hypothetical protein
LGEGDPRRHLEYRLLQGGKKYGGGFQFRLTLDPFQALHFIKGHDTT